MKSIATTTFQDGGLPILDGNCSFHRQASFYASNWPEGTKVAEDGDVFAFYLPGVDTSSKPVLGGGEFIAAFNDRPEVAAFQTYLSTDLWANNKADATPNGGWVSANKGLDAEQADEPDRQARGDHPAGPEDGVPLRRQRPDAGRGRLGRLLEAGHELDRRPVHQGHRGQDRGRLAEVTSARPGPRHAGPAGGASRAGASLRAATSTRRG